MRTVKEIDLALKNEPGQLAAIYELFLANGIQLLAFCLATGQEEGRLRFVASDPERAINILKTARYEQKAKEVIAFEAPKHPGGLNAVLKPLKAANINIDNIYPCIGTGDMTVFIIEVGPIEQALRIMDDNWIRVVGSELHNI